MFAAPSLQRLFAPTFSLPLVAAAWIACGDSEPPPPTAGPAHAPAAGSAGPAPVCVRPPGCEDLVAPILNFKACCTAMCWPPAIHSASRSVSRRSAQPAVSDGRFARARTHDRWRYLQLRSARRRISADAVARASRGGPRAGRASAPTPRTAAADGGAAMDC
jgi:hypothetical protein